MKKKKLIIYGIGPFAEYAAYVFNNDSSFEVTGFCIEKAFIDKDPSSKILREVVPFESLENELRIENHFLFIAVGNNSIRKRIFLKAKQMNLFLATYISSKVNTWPNLIVGENCFIDEGTVMQPFVSIGDNSFILISTLGHHTNIGSHSLISVSTLGGGVKIGDCTYLGMNSVIKQKTVIAERNIIGMGCAIESDTEPDSVYTHKGTVKRSITFDEIEHRFLK